MLAGVYVDTEDLVRLAAEPQPNIRARRATGGHSGSLISRARGRGVDLDEVRLYQAGDDVRNIDWKVTARKQKAHTKIFREERERPTVLVIDQSPSMFFGSQVRMKSVAAAEIAARLAWRTLNTRDRIGGIVIGSNALRVLKPLRSKLNVIRLLNALSEANHALNSELRGTTTSRVAWHDVLANIRHTTPIGHRIVFVSDFEGITDVELQQLLVLQNHNELALIHVYDQLEEALPPSGTYNVTDGANTLSFSSSSRQNQNQYRERFEVFKGRLRDACRARGIRYESITTADDASRISIHE